MRGLYNMVAVAAFFMCVGCERSSEIDQPLRIVPEIETRVSGLHFETGDAIGVTIRCADGNYVENRRMNYDGTLFTGEKLLWYDKSSDQSTLTAYYPYAESGQPSSFAVATDQQSDQESSDLLAAVKTAVTPSNAPVGMTFYHLMSQIKIVVTNNSSSPIHTIALDGFVCAATIHFEELTATPQQGVAAARITAFVQEANKSYRAIVVPQQTTVTVIVTTQDGKIRSRSLSQTILVGGKSYDLGLTLSNADLDVTLSGSVEDWQPGGALGDDAEKGTLSYGGVTYPTRTIGGAVWMAANLQYQPSGTTLGVGVWHPVLGADAVATSGLLYDYATATCGTSTTTPVQGVCPTGWHLPDRSELETLAANLTAGDDFLSVGGFMRVGSGATGYGDQTKGYLLSSTAPELGKCACLSYTATTAPQLATLSAAFGISVRCVKN